jgi:AcrR family transcriptional regulator
MGLRESAERRQRRGTPSRKRRPVRRPASAGDTHVTRRAENAAATRRALLSRAQELFAQRGYADVSLDEICRRARVTKGALYHHFRDKRDLFRAVCVRVEEDWVAKTLAVASAEPDPFGRLQLGCQSSLDGCLDPTVQRILLIDGPAVLDWQELRELDAHRGLGVMRATLKDAMDAGEIEQQPVGPLARLLLGALTEAALAIARDADPQTARRQLGWSLARLIDGLRTDSRERRGH